MTPGFVVLSYFISLVGSLCTLELLIRRTSNRGLTNIALLTAAGICFGAVSVFSMHFVGNQALTLYHPLDELHHAKYLTYSAGYTVLSMVVSCLAMTFAFYVMGTDFSTGHRLRIRKRRSSLELRRHETIERWKAQRPHLKGANVDTIFAQAGLSGSWSVSSSTPSSGRRTWYQKLTRQPLAPESRYGDFDDDVLDDLSVRRDKDLDELEFRLGRNAVRAELDRRQLKSGTPSAASTETPGSTPDTSLRGVPMHLAMSTSSVTTMPRSPLARFYSADDPTAVGMLSSSRSLSSPAPSHELFASTYEFPPRSTPSLPADSQTHLLPKLDGSTSSLLSVAPHHHPYAVENMTPAAVYNPPSQLATGRRSSYPALAIFPPTHAPTPLARIQSLPEHDSAETQSSVPYRDSTESSKDTHGQGLGSDDNTIDIHIDHLDHVMYDDEPFRLRKVGWREELRDKVQSGAPLTKRERVLRFFGLDIVTLGDIIKVIITGTLASWGVAAMHYIGQVSINDIPYIGYRVAYVVGSVIIASGAVIVALYIMFIMLRPKLKHSWVSKILVAVILAGAVCGMHYTAMEGTIYGWPAARNPYKGVDMSENKRTITGIVAALAFVACLGVATFILVNSIRDRKERARRRRIVVASVLLDDEGRILVSAIDGLLPMCDIAALTPRNGKKNRGPGDTLDLTTANVAFVQSLKMSWSWRNPFWSAMNPFASVTDLLMGNSTDDTSTEMSMFAPPGRRGSVFTASESVVSGISTIPTQRLSVSRFLERFALAATQLSVRLTGQENGIGRLGVLYDRILTTGWVNLNSDEKVSKGQLLFLVRRVSSLREKSDLLSRHFIFAPPTAVATALHKTLSTPYNNVMPLLEDMRGFVDTSMRMTLRPNTLYAGVVVVQATPFDGLRILLDKRNRSQLPMREVCTFSTLGGLPVNVTEGLAGTLEEIGEAASWLEGMSLLNVISRNMQPEGVRVGGPRVGRLLSALERAVIPLLDGLLSQDDMAYILPRLQLYPVLLPLTPATPGIAGHPGWAAPHILVFYANYDYALRGFAEEWAPFSLFRAQNECVMASKVNRIERAAEAASALQRPPRAPSPTLAPGTSLPPPLTPVPSVSTLPATPGTSTEALRYNYGRRPSKVQFEVPEPPTSPAPTNSDTVSSRERPGRRRSSFAKTAVMSSTADSPMLGVGVWDPEWLVHLLRTRLRAEPELIGKEWSANSTQAELGTKDRVPT